jgi:hypothetical protein
VKLACAGEGVARIGVARESSDELVVAVARLLALPETDVRHREIEERGRCHGTARIARQQRFERIDGLLPPLPDQGGLAASEQLTRCAVRARRDDLGRDGGADGGGWRDRH